MYIGYILKNNKFYKSMSKAICIVGVRGTSGNGMRDLQNAIPSSTKCIELVLERDRFKLGSLDNML